MALLSEALKEKEVDIRMIERSLAKGVLLQEEVDQYVKKLADDTANAETINLENLLEVVGAKAGLRG